MENPTLSAIPLTCSNLFRIAVILPAVPNFVPTLSLERPLDLGLLRVDVLHSYRDGRVSGGSRDRVRVRVVVRQSCQRRMAQVVRDELLGLILLSGKQAGRLERLVTLSLSKLFSVNQAETY